MSKVKLTTVSGTVIEKPVVTCFKNANGSYLVLDNEANGTMGLPIILVCKLFNGKVTKILDQGEWQSVKENLKSIIAGNPIEFESIPAELSADDVYYTQLTLPVNSFEALKKSYNVPETTAPAASSSPDMTVVPSIPQMDGFTPMPEMAAPVMEASPVAPVAPEMPVIPEVPQMEVPAAPMPEVAAPVMEASPVAPVAPDMPVVSEVPQMEIPAAPMPEVAAPVMEATPVAPVASEMPVVPEVPQMEIPAAPMPEVSTPVVEPVKTNITADDIAEMKETFMKACENMFDALVIKLQNK